MKSKNNGFITLHRKITGWEWYDHLPTRAVFVHLLLTVNHKTQKWRGNTIKRGQRIFGRKLLADEVGISVQQLRTAIKNLQSTSEITIETSSQGSVVTVVKYGQYQDKTSKATSDQPTNNQRSTSDQPLTNNDNNVNNDNIIDDPPKKKKRKTYSYTKDFEDFWLAYPEITRPKGDKRAAYKAFETALTRAKIEEIAKGLNSYANYIKRSNTFNKNASGWLNEDGWRVDYDKFNVSGQGNNRRKDQFDAVVDVSSKLHERYDTRR